jgi:hypothetical protein
MIGRGYLTSLINRELTTNTTRVGLRTEMA